MKIWFAGNPVDSDEKHVLEVGGKRRLFSFYEKGYLVRFIRRWERRINVKSVQSVSKYRRRG